MKGQAVRKKSDIVLSTADPDLLKTRLPGGEFLLNHMISQASGQKLPATVYLMHDWAMANKKQFPAFAKYIDQPKEQIDDAITLFALNRDSICTPADAKPGEFALLPLYLLYDCLIHVGSLKRHARAMGYLSRQHKKSKCIGIDDFLQFGKSGMIYNYVRIDGQVRIAGKHYYHSEIAEGKPVQGAGEIELIRNPDGSVKKIRLNYFTGHYRVTADVVDAVVGDIEKVIAQQPTTPQGRPRIFLAEDSLKKHTL